jgi:hypothetical protein
MATASERLARPDAADRIAREVLEAADRPSGPRSGTRGDRV